MNRKTLLVLRKITLTAAWVVLLFCLSIVWNVARPEITKAIASIPTEHPKAVAAFFAALITMCKLGLLVPLWFIWRQRKEQSSSSLGGSQPTAQISQEPKAPPEKTKRFALGMGWLLATFILFQTTMAALVAGRYDSGIIAFHLGSVGVQWVALCIVCWLGILLVSTLVVGRPTGQRSRATLVLGNISCNRRNHGNERPRHL